MAVELKKIAENNIDSKEALLEMISPSITKIKIGHIVPVKIVAVDRDELTVDLNYKTEGVILVKEYYASDQIKHFDPEEIKVGDIVDALVVKLEDNNGRIVLSKRRAIEKNAWKNIEKAKENNTIIKGTVLEIVKGGLIIDVGIKAFVPASLIDIRRVTNYDDYIGKELDFRVLDIKKLNKTIILSRKDVLLETQRKNRELIMSELEVGQIRSGKVSALTDFGAFIDLGGMDGLVHLSEISWKTIDKASDVLNIGDEVTVQVTELDQAKARVSLSIRATEHDPWQDFVKDHVIGQIVKGKIIKTLNYGIQVNINDYISGLIHGTDLTDDRIKSFNDVFPIDTDTFVKIIDIDLIRHRISLSVRKATESINLEATDSDSFDPAIYGMKTEYNEDGSYKYPEGFDPKAGKWLKGFQEQRKIWEDDYAKAKSLWDAHKEYVKVLNKKIDDFLAYK